MHMTKAIPPRSWSVVIKLRGPEFMSGNCGGAGADMAAVSLLWAQDPFRLCQFVVEVRAVSKTRRKRAKSRSLVSQKAAHAQHTSDVLITQHASLLVQQCHDNRHRRKPKLS